jgi:putative oxidoreductase
MTDYLATAPRPLDNAAGEVAMSRLADRLLAMAPPGAAANLAAAPMPRPSPAVAAALSTSAKISARAAERARRSRSIVGVTVDSFVSACSFIPYALVALALRLVMARVFFLDGQTRIEGPRVPLNVRDFDFSVVLPLHVKAETFTAFLGHYVALPVPSVLAAYLVSYAEFILPICLVLGFATRFAALGMLIMTALIQIYVMPEALWSTHVYWASILLVLLSMGAGQISVDHIIRFVARRA